MAVESFTEVTSNDHHMFHYTDIIYLLSFAVLTVSANISYLSVYSFCKNIFFIVKKSRESFVLRCIMLKSVPIGNIPGLLQ